LAAFDNGQDINLAILSNGIVHEQRFLDMGKVNFRKGVYAFKDKKKEIRELKIDANKGTFSLVGLKMKTLSGLVAPIKIKLTIHGGDDNIVFVGEADESIINGKKLISPYFQVGVKDTLRITKAKVSGDLSYNLTTSGRITAKDIDVDLTGDVSVTWGDFSETVNLIRKSTKKRIYSYKIISSNLTDSIRTVMIDLDKCTFEITVKRKDETAFKNYSEATLKISHEANGFEASNFWDFGK